MVTPKSKRAIIIKAAVFGGLMLLVAGLLVGIFMVGRQIFDREAEYRVARREYAQLRGHVNSALDHLQDGGIDFDALSAINPRIIGWIEVPDTSISYPVVQGSDNHYYLYHVFSGVRNSSGTVFLDYRDSSDFSGHARLYGHNMRDGTMFAPLLRWPGDSFTIYTVDGLTLTYRVVFRRVVCVADDIWAKRDDGMLLVTCVTGRPDVRLVTWARLESEVRQ